jgi:hypothetical protein
LAGGGVAGSVDFGISFAGSAGAGVLGGGDEGAEFILSEGEVLPALGAGRSHALRPSVMTDAAAKIKIFMLLLSLKTKMPSVMQVLPKHALCAVKMARSTQQSSTRMRRGL